MKQTWFHLIDDDGEALTAPTSVSTEEIRLGIDVCRAATRLFPGVDSAELSVFVNRAAYDAKASALGASTVVEELTTTPETPLLVQALLNHQESMNPALFNGNSMDIRAPCLERKDLVTKIHASLYAKNERFVYLASPPQSGKTTALSLVSHQHLHVHCVGVSFRNQVSASDLLREHAGIDLNTKHTELTEDDEHLVMIDDAELKYDDSEFSRRVLEGLDHGRAVVVAAQRPLRHRW
ncbi:hypothetical protein Poli38472_014429 [Pythium oligandrum]|uniref:Uncharacterized protein n=1 Tax=Pythium oligandrum TaxID=41045 RepID=A0A8K1FD11_PYTOL|nr:hypothetical protein Poli38472_014429 [Pythium oligandrum]|eukprot:TMW57826.1 hypothetical protein Poli38472_014429 [Pythium oligandrum]